ncbi:hypothetical protein FKP32DRAFT_1478887 [Trametes sanguinea]|nr:hypothetical protein FKP32DRAFT_1478887 [Trametes sanguinea]
MRTNLSVNIHCSPRAAVALTVQYFSRGGGRAGRVQLAPATACVCHSCRMPALTGNNAASSRHSLGEDSSAPLLPAIVEPMKYADIPKAARLTQGAFLHNTLDLYMRAPAQELRQGITIYIHFIDHIMCGRAWTINHGEATLTIGLPKEKGRLFMFFLPFFKLFYTKELVKRKVEYREKVAAMINAEFGDNVDGLMEVQGLATAQQRQGSGYGTALMQHANALADSQKLGVYAITSDAYKFYETMGYSLVQEETLGVNNPAWDGEPVHIRLMYRAPKDKRGEDSATHSAPVMSGNLQAAPQSTGLNRPEDQLESTNNELVEFHCTASHLVYSPLHSLEQSTC